jgi:hypothetical protein
MNHYTNPAISDAQLLHEGKQQGLTKAEAVEIKLARRKEPQIINLFNALDLSNLKNKEYRRIIGDTLIISFS